MKLKSGVLNIFFFVLISYSIAASNIDSLKHVLIKATPKEKCIILNNLCLSYLYVNADSALKYGKRGLEIAKNIPFKSEHGYLLNNIGNIFLEKGENTIALDYYIGAEKIFSAENIVGGRALTSLNFGRVYERQNLLDKALKQYLSSLNIAEEIENRTLIADCANCIGSLYYSKNEKSKSLEYFSKALKTNEAINNIPRIMEGLNNVAVIYQELGKFNEALQYFNTDLEYARNMNIKTDVIAILHNISLVYKDQKDFPNAISYLDSSIYLAKEIRDFDDMREAYSTLSEIYKEQNNFPKALESFQLSAAAKDSLLNQTREKQFIEMSTKYETEKKEAENKLLKIEGEKQRTILIAISGGLALVAALAFLIYNSYRQKKKANVLLALQNTEIKQQKHIIEEKQTEILDSISYAKRLQDAILPPVNLLNQKFENIFLYYQPKDIVAGDFYWMETVSQPTPAGSEQQSTENLPATECILIAAADCTGHGVPGALVSVVCSNALNRAVNEFNLTEPGSILDKTRDLVLETFSKSERDVKDGMDISLVSLQFPSPKERGGNLPAGEAGVKLKWAGANNPIYIISDDHVKEIKGDKFPVGAYVSEHKQNFTTHTLELKKGDRVYIFSDGLPDQFGGPKTEQTNGSFGGGKKYKYKRMQAKLVESCHLPMEEQKAFMRSDLLAWQGRLEQVDDILLIGFEV